MMGFERRKRIGISAVGPDRLLRIDALVNLLQEMAIEHTRSLGISMGGLLESGRTWVLNRLAFHIERHPTLDEELDITTWSRKIERFKGLREFRIEAAGKPLVTASTFWLHLDLQKRRPVRVPEDYPALYGCQNEQALDVDLEAWSPPELACLPGALPITVRPADFDVNGHVNNAVMLQYLETALARQQGKAQRITQLQIAFLKEIGSSVETVHVTCQSREQNGHFVIGQAETQFAKGSFHLT